MSLAEMTASVWGALTGDRIEEKTRVSLSERNLCLVDRWNPERFAQEQIRGLVRRIFSPVGDRPVRQVVFSAIGPETDVSNICECVGEVLASEDAGDVVIDNGYLSIGVHNSAIANPINYSDRRTAKLRQRAMRLRRNLWRMPERNDSDAEFHPSSLHLYLSDLRREFAYSIVAAPPAGESHQALAMAQFADGIILALSAQHTRRIAARKVKDALAHVRLLGTVLCDREFPVPEGIYRRL